MNDGSNRAAAGGPSSDRPGAPRRSGAESKEAVVIRLVRRADVPQVFELMREFAAYVRESRLFTGSAAALEAQLFDRSWPTVECLVAEADRRPVGCAMILGGYSSFWTRPTLWLEDLFVTATHRGRGVGLALMAAVAQIAVERGCPYMAWSVLEWNTTAIDFYRRTGAVEFAGEQKFFRLAGPSLESLAALATG